MEKIEFLKESIKQYEELLKELEATKAGEDALEMIRDSIKNNRDVLRRCTEEVIEVALEPAQTTEVPADAEEGLRAEKVFKNYKELCSFMGWEIYKGGSNSQIAQFKQLNCLCKYHKQGHKIIVDEVYQEIKPKKVIGDIFINPVEAILLFALRSIDNNKEELYFSNNKFYKMLGLFNKNYEELNYSDTKELTELLQMDYLIIKSFKINSKAEANKIIKRALNSLYSRKVIDYTEGRIIVGQDGKSRLASPEERKTIVRLEKESLNKIGCITFQQMEYKNLYRKYYKLLNEKLKEANLENFEYSYRGYCVVSHNKSVAEEISRQCKDENFKKLNDLFVDKMQRVSKSRNKSATKKAIESTGFGEAILTGEASETYVRDNEKLIDRYIKN